jgi:hypothetical protein
MQVRVLLEAVDALVRGRRLILMDIAGSWAGAERVRNPLKKLDRLLSNRHMHEEKPAIYGAMAKWFTERPTSDYRRGFETQIVHIESIDAPPVLGEGDGIDSAILGCEALQQSPVRSQLPPSMKISFTTTSAQKSFRRSGFPSPLFLCCRGMSTCALPTLRRK